MENEALDYKDYQRGIIIRNRRLISNLASVSEPEVKFKFDFKGEKQEYNLTINQGVFNPIWGEGSKIMAEIKDRFTGNVLEIGTGSGILSILAAENDEVKNVIATDISQEALDCAKENIKKYKLEHKISTPIESNLFKKIDKSKTFDTIIFNPPFLLKKKKETQNSNENTEKGVEKSYFDEDYSVLKDFLKDAKDYLTGDGCIYICFGGVGDVGYLNYLVALNKYKVEIIPPFSIINGICFFVYKLSNC